MKEMDVVRAHLISLSLNLDNHAESSFSMSTLDQVELGSSGGANVLQEKDMSIAKLLERQHEIEVTCLMTGKELLETEDQ